MCYDSSNIWDENKDADKHNSKEIITPNMIRERKRKIIKLLNFAYIKGLILYLSCIILCTLISPGILQCSIQLLDI